MESHCDGKSAGDKPWRVRLLAGAALALALCLAPLSHAQQGMLPRWEDLPDWSGTWSREPGTAFDEASWTMNGAPADARRGDASVNTPGTRAHPPYNETWEAIYQEHLRLRDLNRFPDPLTRCIAHGFPRIFNVNSPVEFVVRPEQVWILAEHTRSTMRIYTDGRAHSGYIWPTLFGESIGHWEGDTLVFTTKGLKGWKDRDNILDRSGLVLSEDMSATTRIQKVREEKDGVMADMLRVEITLEDPQALTEHWKVVKRFYKDPPGTMIYDYECNENNRAVVDENGRSLIVGPDGEIIE